ncbi:hypothetical protein KM176_13085 [Pseudooceanicola sp. CBS1P-1]|uniref:Uncharacterized protein n=1 Tax=Pseudooceanicola albus TaxID=2692189 RepID=A0A6L7G3W4_9RHOB|nr:MULTISPECIES: hypothetical protein [Pseudooceanicola]MBT9384797.1 hypothetical protein [Pseudooceanicola endophyticus]MXN18208.1 hypothetical protein [Pseudooceanicola albus]
MLIFVPIAFVLAIVLIWIYGKPSMKGCRWRMNHAHDQDGKTFYRCAACGASLLSEDGRPPQLCLSHGS